MVWRTLQLGLAVLLLAAACGRPAVAQSEDLSVLNRQVVELHQAGRYAEASPVAQRALELAERLHGGDHPEVGAALNRLAELHRELGRYAEAEPLYTRALSIRENAHGAASPDVAETLNNLASLYREQRRYADAEPLFKRSLAIREKALGPNDPSVAATLNNLGSLYRVQGRYAEAEPLYMRSLAIREKALGPDHRDVATTLNNLGSLYRVQGRYAEAEPLYTRSLAIREKALGLEHRLVGATLNNLASLYGAQARYADAEQLYKRSLAIREKALRPDHPSVATTLNNLATLYRAQGRYSDAEQHYKRSLAIIEKALGSDHPDVGENLIKIAELYRAQGRTDDAEPLFQRALAIPKIDTKVLTILFGTNRHRAGSEKTPTYAGKRAQQLNLGHAVLLAARELVVQRAERRARGTGILDRSLGDLTSEQLFDIRRIAAADSMAELAKAMRPSPKQALVFVHGYNIDFEAALKRTAQIAFDLDFDGPSFLFTWPSSARFLSYGYDRESADIAVDYFIEFLGAVGTQMPGMKLNLIAHSMGNIVVLSALEKIALRSASDRKLVIGEIVLAHPDVDRDRFKQLAKAIQGLGKGMTLYTTRDDRAMWISRWYYSGARRAGGVPIVVPGVDTIDFTGLGASLWTSNHSTYAANPIVFGDISRLIATSERPPDQRTKFFEQTATAPAAYWRFRRPEGAQQQ